MLARLRKSVSDDSGFTLIELLVVMIILGILAAIAIPVFLSQRQKAVDASMKSDARNIANEEFAYFVDNQDYALISGTQQAYTVNGTKVSTSQGNTLTVTREDGTGAPISTGAANGFCVLVTNPSGSHPWVYQSQSGGLQPASVTSC